MLNLSAKKIFPLMIMGRLALAGVDVATAQPVLVKPLRPTQPSGQAMTPATVQDPARLRNLLLAIHGFSREALDSASADVPLLLRRFIEDEQETVTVQRQAIKALRLYPSQENLTFIQARVGSAPVTLKRLYATTLGRYSGALQQSAQSTLRTMVSDPDVGVRHAAIGAVRLLGVDETTRKTIGDRLRMEADASVRRAMKAALSD